MMISMMIVLLIKVLFLSKIDRQSFHPFNHPAFPLGRLVALKIVLKAHGFVYLFKLSRSFFPGSNRHGLASDWLLVSTSHSDWLKSLLATELVGQWECIAKKYKLKIMEFKRHYCERVIVPEVGG